VTFVRKLSPPLIFTILVCYISSIDSNLVAAQPFVDDSKIKADVVYEGLDFPTSMGFLETDDILVLEKDKATIQRIVNGQL
jgi:aldose sugar dehydrogenase